jgi:dihydrodipicolinate synthase/N-acetylneuraminate lyase
VHLIDCFRRGIVGTMPGVDLLDGVVALWRALERDDEATAYRLYFPICALVTLQLQAGLDGFLAIEKHLLVRRGLFASARRRRPYQWELDTETADEADRLFAMLKHELATG